VLEAAGESAFFALSVIGCLYMISRRFGNAKAFILVFVGLIPFIIGYSRAFQIWLVPERWVFFAQILYAVPLALALLIVCSWFRGMKARSLVLGTTVMVLTLLMILGPIANVDQNLGNGATWVRYSFTSSELTAVNTIAHKSNGDIASDAYYVTEMYLFYYPEVAAHQVNGTNASNPIFLVRAAEGGGSFSVASLYQGNATLYGEFTPGEWNTTDLGSRIYDSGSVTGYQNTYDTYNSLLRAP
jgi:hypothetical protein